MIKVEFLPFNITVNVSPGTTILQAAIIAGLQVESTCGGKGTCGKCKVQIQTDNPASAASVEKKFLSSAELNAGWVLACQRTLFEDAIVTLKEHKDASERKIKFSVTNEIKVIAPGIRKYALVVPVPRTDDPTADWERLINALPGNAIRFSRPVAASLPRILRQKNFQVTAILDGESLLAVEPGDTSDRCFGLAIDIGTTTIVVHLNDLNKGTVLDSGAMTNPQNAFGADVIARITHAASTPQGLHELQEKVIGGLNIIIAQLTEKHKVQSEEIYQAVVVGNTTMSHLFLGIDPTYLAPAPFTPVYQQAVEVEARELGLNMLSTGTVIVLPNVAGYVGSDTVGVMLAAGADHLEGINLIVDIGTNGEIVLVGKDKILTCSTAAGPAFEGAEIKNGMRASEGAIEGVHISTDVELTVIGGGKARGICGSGLIDALAEMVRTGVVDPSGRLANKEPQLEKLPSLLRGRLRGDGHISEFVLVWGKDSATGEDIVLTQKDIRELQLAKGAIMAGIQILLRKMEVEPEEINRVLLAGAFGNFIKKESALGIGLLPPLPLGRIVAIGNAAGDGAKMALLSTEEKARAISLARRAIHIELSSDKDFQSAFVDSLSFGRDPSTANRGRFKSKF